MMNCEESSGAVILGHFTLYGEEAVSAEEKTDPRKPIVNAIVASVDRCGNDESIVQLTSTMRLL